jgi:LysM repeat protein
VESGETLSAIAKAYGVKMKTISQANNLSNPNNLRLGQTLFIPE